MSFKLSLITMLALQSIYCKKMEAQDTTHILNFDKFPVPKYPKHFAFNSVNVVDSRIQDQPFANIETGIFPRERILFPENFQIEFTKFMERAIKNDSNESHLLTVNIKEFRLLNNPFYIAFGKTFNGQFCLRVNVKVSYPVLKNGLSYTRYRTVNRLYRFDGFRYVNGAVRFAVNDILAIAGDEHGSLRFEFGFAGPANWFAFADDNSKMVANDILQDSSRSNDSDIERIYPLNISKLPKGRFSYVDFQHLVLHKGIDFIDSLSLDHTSGCYVLTKTPSFLRGYPAFITIDKELYVQLHDRYFLKVDTAAGLKINIPEHFPDLYSFYSFVWTVYTPGATAANEKWLKKNYSFRALKLLFSGAKDRRAYQTNAIDFPDEKVKFGTDKLICQFDPYSGDILY